MHGDISSAIKDFLDLTLSFTVKDFLVLFLAAYGLYGLLKLRRLSRIIKAQKQEAGAPVLILEVDETNAGLFLVNQSTYCVRQVKIQDMTISNLLNFNKPLTFKFEPIHCINPQESVFLQYQLFDGAYKIGPADSKTLIPHLAHACFEMVFEFSNVNGIVFCETLIKDKEGTMVKEIVPLAQKKIKANEAKTNK